MSKPRKEMIKFFKELDKLLEERVELTVIGGTAMVLGYASERMTHDCDPWGKIEKMILEKWGDAEKMSGVKISIDTAAGVAQMPDGFEDRLEEVDLKLKNLVIRYPDKYDLALSKISRLLGNDLDDILWLHKQHKLDLDILVERYKEEFRIVYVGNTRNLDLNFLDAIEELYGVSVREKVAL